MRDAVDIVWLVLVCSAGSGAVFMRFSCWFIVYDFVRGIWLMEECLKSIIQVSGFSCLIICSEGLIFLVLFCIWCGVVVLVCCWYCVLWCSG